MNIGVLCYPTFGGSGVMATELGLALARKGHEVHFISSKQPVRMGTFCQNVFYHEIYPINYDLFKHEPYESAMTGKLIEVIKFAKLDVLHVHYAIPHAIVAFLAKSILKSEGKIIPYVTTLHGTDITIVGEDANFKPIVEYSINQSDVVTAVSQYLKKATIDNFNIKKEIDVVYNFVDINKFKKLDKDHFKKMLAPNGEKVLIHVSNFRKVKRVSDIIYAFEKVLKKQDCKLLLVGDGPDRQQAEDLCRSLNICDKTVFLGKQMAVEEILAISDVFILPSEKESFGLAALEAMACGIPVISSNTGGIPEVNIHGKTGFMCDIGDIDCLADSVIKLLGDDELLNQFKQSAFEQSTNFDISKILPAYEALYEKAIAQSKIQS